MFGTGYGGLEPPEAGSFQVWKLKGDKSKERDIQFGEL
jgi:hypothetical protein